MKHILIIEDNTDICLALELLLELNGLKVSSVHTVKDAQLLLQRKSVDLIIQDMNFSTGFVSGEEGRQLFYSLRDNYPELPIIVMTAWASVEMAVELVKNGAFDYLEKPWNDQHLIDKIKGTLLAHDNRQIINSQDSFIYKSDVTGRLLDKAKKVASADINVLITGPNGAGKERLADVIHQYSERCRKPLVKVNMGAIPQELMEAELFGAVDGAYTGAKARQGRFKAADGGTLLLDEIGNLSLSGQMKLLRVLQSGEFEAVGSDKTEKVDVRVISATNSALVEAIQLGSFREDLYYRLNVIELCLPPLAARVDDIVPLATHFLKMNGYQFATLPDEVTEALRRYPWPGNVRELENACKRATIFAHQQVCLDDFGLTGASFNHDVEENDCESKVIDRSRLLAVLTRSDWNIAQAANQLKLSRQAIYRRMEKFDIQKPEK